MKLNEFFVSKSFVNETIDSEQFKKILKLFLPIAKDILRLKKLPTIILKKTLSVDQQPTMGRFFNETYTLEIAIANRQPVDILRTLAHELVHAKQNEEHVDIDPTTGSPEENEAHELAGIIMRHFNKMHPEFLRLEPVQEGGNLAVGGHEAQQIDLKVHTRSYIVPVLDKVLHAINTSFAQKYKVPLWKPALLQNRKFLSGSSLHFFNTDISDDEFIAKKPKVGDIDTQVDRNQEQNLEAFLTSVQDKMVGPAKCLGFSRGNEQFSSLWELQNPPIKVQIDLEFVAYEKDEPTQWAQFSHSSSWEDLTSGIKGVFHKYMMRALTANSATEKYVARQLKKGVKISDEPVTDNNVSFAVSSKQGGGMRTKYVPYTDPATGQPMIKNGIPVMLQVPPGESEYVQDLGQQYQMLFGQPGNEADQKLMWSFLGLIKLANKYLEDNEKQATAIAFEEMLFGKGAQGLYKGDPKRDQQEKMAALNTMAKQLQGIDAGAVLNKAKQDGVAYYQQYKGTDENVNINEAGEVKAQLRKGMPHLRDLKPIDFLDLVDELSSEGGKFKLQNIPLNVKIDGFGGRFGKNSDGKPFMGTSRTEPRYSAGFVDYHKQKGTTDPDILGRAANFDKLFDEVMAAIKLVDSKLGPDFLVDKQVTCEILFLPFATKTEEGKLKFVGIEYNQLPQGVDLVLVPYRIVQASTGEDIPNGDKIAQQIADLGQSGNVMFMSNRLAQKEALDVTEIINVLDNIEELKKIVSDTTGKRDRASIELRKQVEEKLKPVQIALEKAIDEDPNIVGKDNLGQEYEGIVINSRLGPIKVTSQKQKDIITAKNAARAAARAEQPRENANKTAVVAVGSAIGHVGHQQLFNYAIQKAEQVGGDPYMFIGPAEGKDDPIPPSVKVETWKKLYPQYANNISTVAHEGGTLLQKIKHELINPLPGKAPRYDNIIITVGSDRADLANNWSNALMKAVNKFQGYEHVKVTPNVTGRGEKEGGTGVSGTQLRNVLKDPNQTPQQQFAVWDRAYNSGDFGAEKLSPEYIKHLMDIARKGMGIAKPHTSPSGVRTNMSPKDDDYAINYGPQGQAKPKQDQMAEEIGPMNTPLRRFMIKQIARITGWGISDLELASEDELQELFMKYVPGAERKIERFNRAVAEITAMEYQDRMAGVGMGNYVVDKDTAESMLPKKTFAGANHNKLGPAGQLKGKDKRPARAGDLVGEDGVEEGWKARAAGAALAAANLLGSPAQAAEEPVKPITVAYVMIDGEMRTYNLGDRFKNAKEAEEFISGVLDKQGLSGYQLQIKHGYPKKKDEPVKEAKQKGVDGKACWKGYKRMGTKKKGGKTVDNCVKVGEAWEAEISKLVKVLESK